MRFNVLTWYIDGTCFNIIGKSRFLNSCRCHETDSYIVIYENNWFEKKEGTYYYTRIFVLTSGDDGRFQNAQRTIWKSFENGTREIFYEFEFQFGLYYTICLEV